MNLILLFQEDFIANSVVSIKGRRLKYIKEVHNAKQGDELWVGLQNDLIGKGKVIKLTNTVLEMDVTFNIKPPEPLPVTLIMAMPRPKVFNRVIECITTMGVKELFIIKTWRVEKSFWSSLVLSKDNIEKHLILGLEQAKDTIMPKVYIRKFFKPFLDNELSNIIKDTFPIVAHPGSDVDCPINIEHKVTLAIGPEGGFIQYEIDKLKDIGFLPVNLGPRILKVETAVPVLLSKLFR